MKYSETLIKKTITAIDNHPEHSFWRIHRGLQNDELNYCEIRFENLDNVKMSIRICENEVSAIVYKDDNRNDYEWFGSCNIKKTTNDVYMMWLGTKLSRMSNFAEEIIEAK